jgi:response regulator RpfG family c-di-GMP phosphodiesterase
MTQTIGNAALKSKIFLCVDDDATVLTALSTLLSKTLGSGVTLEVAESGAEALEICTELQSKGLELSVVVSDFIMPGMRGDELLVAIHKMSPSTVKIMLTGQSDLEGVKRTINEANLYRFLEKPFNNADFVLTAKAALHAYAQEHDTAEKIGSLMAEKESLQQRLALCDCDAAAHTANRAAAGTS